MDSFFSSRNNAAAGAACFSARRDASLSQGEANLSGAPVAAPRARTRSSRHGGIRSHRRNAVVIVLLFAFAAALYAATAFALPARETTYAVVHASDGSEKTLSLGSDQKLTVTTDVGTNVVVVENGTVRVDQADCPGQDCVQQGAIKNQNQQIVCLPHKLWIEIVGNEDEHAFDSVTR